MNIATVFHSGNTLRLTIPRPICQALRLTARTKVVITLDGNNRATLRNADTLIEIAHKLEGTR